MKNLKKIGSQTRQKIEDSEYELVDIFGNGEAVLKDKDTGKRELYQERDNFAGFVIEIDGKGYEFVRSL